MGVLFCCARLKLPTAHGMSARSLAHAQRLAGQGCPSNRRLLLGYQYVQPTHMLPSWAPVMHRELQLTAVIVKLRTMTAVIVKLKMLGTRSKAKNMQTDACCIQSWKHPKCYTYWTVHGPPYITLNCVTIWSFSH